MSLSSVVTMGYQPAGSISLVTTLGYALTGTLPTTVALSGTILSATTEDDIRAGGKTIVLTLTNNTWAPAGGAFDAVRQAIINGLQSAQAEPTGWNVTVVLFMPVTAVVRTSDTVVTITLPAFPAYNITAAETITDTVPTAALVTPSSPIVAVPTFDISAVAPAAAAQTRFGGGPFWRSYCDWDEEDERELRALEKQERELEKRVDKSQRALARASAPLPDETSEAEERRRISRLDSETARIAVLAARLEDLHGRLEQKRREREEADEFMDCVVSILMEEEE